jgi:hypothetical protein
MCQFWCLCSTLLCAVFSYSYSALSTPAMALSAMKLLGSALLLSQLCSATPVDLQERQAYALVGVRSMH